MSDDFIEMINNIDFFVINKVTLLLIYVRSSIVLDNECFSCFIK